jgi:DHA1 family bicyclomycin/chloramphenicol resistance-like MFS transporter
MNKVQPSLWLMIMIAGLPQFAETVYTPSLPEVSHYFQISESIAEYTITIYLAGFAFGVLFWGNISDKIGRRPCVLWGLVTFSIGSMGCYLSTNIEFMMCSRFIQAFGGSIGSVIGQAICRDSFHGAELGQIYAIIGSALGFFPAIGPIIGGLIAEHFVWYSVFLFLIIWATILFVAVALNLPETCDIENTKSTSILDVASKLMHDRDVIFYTLIVAACNGIGFSYFAEGSFYLINLLGLSPTEYGSTFIFTALSAVVGGFVSKKLLHYYEARKVMSFGIITIFIGSLIFSIIAVFGVIIEISKANMIFVTIGSQTLIMFGTCIAITNSLASALVNYKYCIGTASSLFGFSYYVLISLFTLLMGILHNGSLLTMPLYFLVISTGMVFLSQKCHKF